MLFFLDEPQILVGKSGVKGGETGSNYIPYRNSEIGEKAEQDKIYQLGMSFDMKERRNGIIRELSEDDMRVYGTKRVNPLIGRIPSKDEIYEQIDDLMMSM